MDQAEKLRAMMGSEEARARVIAVTSGKGGVGKTNLSVNLAIGLARLGKKAILIDVDIGLANADVLLGVQPRFHLGHLLSGEVSPLDALQPTEHGVYLLPGSNGTVSFSDLEDNERRFLIASFQHLERYADFLIIDTGAGISSNVVQFARAADEVIVVTTPEPTSITDGYAMIKTLARSKTCGPIRVVINQAADRIEAGQVAERLRTVCSRFLELEVESLGYVLADERVQKAVRRRRPFIVDSPRGPASQCVQQLCHRIVGKDAATRPRRFFARFAEALAEGRPA